MGQISRRRFLQGTAVVSSGLMAGTITSAPVRATDMIRVGHQCDLTGALASTGYWRKKTADAAANWINKNGGIAGRQIEIVTIDTESKVDVGILRLRQLLQESQVDFVLGSEHGGISVASNPIMLEQKTLYLSQSRTDAVTGAAANPFVFRLMVNTSLAGYAAAPPIIAKGWKRWSMIYADYVWGHAHRDTWLAQFKKAEVAVGSVLPVPVNTADPLSFVSRIDRSSDAIFVALLGPDMPRVLIALDQLGLGDKTKVLVDAGFGVFDVLKMGKQAENMWGMDCSPFELADHDTPHERNMRAEVGIDASGREVGTNRACMIGDVWPMWESLSFLKQTVEGSGWKTKNDTAALIKYAESNPDHQESALFPQGDLFVRPQDHQAFCDYYVLRIKDGHIRTDIKIPKDKGIYPATINLASK